MQTWRLGVFLGLLGTTGCSGDESGGGGPPGGGGSAGSGGSAGASAGGSAGATSGGGSAGTSSGGTAGSEPLGSLSAEIDGTLVDFDSNQFAHHYDGLGTTAIGGMWLGNGAHSIDLAFEGNASGTYDCSEQSGHRMSYSRYEGGTLTEYLSTTPCSIVVSSYGVVGQKLIGTFSATLGTDGGPDIELQNGSFDLTRQPDSP